MTKLPSKVHSLARAFRLFGEQPADVEIRKSTVARTSPWTKTQLDAAEAQLGFAMPQEYRLLLETYGTYSITDGDERTVLLAPSRNSEESGPLYEHLQELRKVLPADDPFGGVMSSPRDALLVASVYYDLNTNPQWQFYVRGSERLFEVHIREPIEELDSLEERLIAVACAFAGFDERSGSWYSR